MTLRSADSARRRLELVEDQPKKFLFGLDLVVRYVVMALITPLVRDGTNRKEFSQAHTIIEDDPGTGKTALFNYVSAAIEAKLGRFDGRSDAMPGDFTGREEVDRATGIRTVLKGPLFSNIVFGDELNRNPPKALAPFFGAMDGAKVTMNITDVKEGRIDPVAFTLYPVFGDALERNFCIVFAAMNPIDFEGTYTLDAAHVERFTYRLTMGFPAREKEMMISADNVMNKEVEVVMNLSELLDIQEMVSQIKLSADATELRQRYMENSRPYDHDLRVFRKRMPRHAKPVLVDRINEYVIAGCSPRRNLHIEGAAKAHAFMRGEDRVATIDDVRAVAPLTMEHVIRLAPKAEAEGWTAKRIVQMIIDETLL